MANHNFKNLKIWQEGISLVDETYDIISQFPSLEKFNLIQQLIRCSVSIPSNIAEGTSKSTDRHFKKYLDDSLGSAFEWETQIIIAERRKYINKEQFKLLEGKIQQLQKMISGFTKHLDI